MSVTRAIAAAGAIIISIAALAGCNETAKPEALVPDSELSKLLVPLAELKTLWGDQTLVAGQGVGPDGFVTGLRALSEMNPAECAGSIGGPVDAAYAGSGWTAARGLAPAGENTAGAEWVIAMPGVSPIEVSTGRPPAIADAEAPLPRCSTT